MIGTLISVVVVDMRHKDVGHETLAACLWSVSNGPGSHVMPQVAIVLVLTIDPGTLLLGPSHHQGIIKESSTNLANHHRTRTTGNVLGCRRAVLIRGRRWHERQEIDANDIGARLLLGVVGNDGVDETIVDLLVALLVDHSIEHRLDAVDERSLDRYRGEREALLQRYGAERIVVGLALGRVRRLASQGR